MDIHYSVVKHPLDNIPDECLAFECLESASLQTDILISMLI